MSQGFRLKFDEMRESDPTAREGQTGHVPEKVMYDQPGPMRDVCFVWPDGTHLALGYSFLVSKKLKVDGELNEIVLAFTSDTITLKGHRLMPLFVAIMEQRALYIIAEDARYQTEEFGEPSDKPVVLNIALTPKA